MKRNLCLAVGQLLLAFLLLNPSHARAGAAPSLQLVSDINQTPSQLQSSPAQFTSVNGTVIFAATSSTSGRELWKTNGTIGNANLVMDIWPGNQGSDPAILGVIGTFAYFAANDGVNGRELWRTNGTSTELVKDIFPGADGSNPFRGGVHNGLLFVCAQGSEGNFELWRSDGTSGGTFLVQELQPNSAVNKGSNPDKFTTCGGFMYFTAYTDPLGTELYKSDGSLNSITLVKDLRTGNGNSSTIFQPVSMGGTLYFGGSDGVSGNELWRSDGTAAGTVLVKDINTSGNAAVSSLLVVGSTLYFRAASSGFNYELWKSDGTDVGTVLVKDIWTGPNGGDPFGFAAVGSQVFFFANDGTTGIELWKTDGTTGGTSQVKDLLPGTGFGARVNDPGTAPPMLEVIGTTAYFYGSSGTASGGELWKTDGTSANTTMVKELGAGAAHAVVREMKAIGSKLYFSAAQPSGGTEPYVSDGSSAGTDILKDLSTGTAASNPKHLTPAGGKLYFSANDGVNGRELWVSDGNGAQVTRVGNNKLFDNDIGAVGAVNGTAFFGYINDAGQYELWKSDGTAPGTIPVGQAPPLAGLSVIPGAEGFQAVGNLMFFQAETDAYGLELWKTDGTAAGTGLIKDISPGLTGTAFEEAVVVGNVMYIVAETDTYGSQIWRSDGTAAGTKILKAPSASWDVDDPYSLCPLGTTLYFSADGEGGSELYKSNGTAGGTVLVKDVNDGSSFAGQTTPLNATTVLFTATSPAKGHELWKSDGTVAGTVLVKDIYPGVRPNNPNVGNSSSPSALTPRGNGTFAFGVLNGVAYFSADDGVNGRELWRSDGTDAGTFMVKDIAAGSASSTPGPLLVVGNQLYFVVTVSGGDQLWTSDGTQNGTFMLDSQVSDIIDMAVSGTTLYVVGSQAGVGSELFRLPNVRQAPFQITQQPGPPQQTLAVNGSTTLTVATSGATPTFQWRRNGVAIPGATKASFVVSKASEAIQGSYDVLLRSSDFELLSNPAQVDVADPAKVAIFQQPQARLALSGTSASFQVSVVGNAPQFQWFKGTTLIPGATSATFTLASVLVSDAGLYKVRVSNNLGSVFSAAVQLAVVNALDQFVPAKTGATLAIPAPAVGAGLTFLWSEFGDPVVNGGRISGASTSKLAISKFTSADETDYRCVVSLGTQSVTSGLVRPRVAAVPVIAPTASPPTWIISGPVSISAVSNFLTSLASQSNPGTGLVNTPTLFSITGLPKGMTYDTKTGIITGRPQLGGGTTINVVIKAGNVAGMMTTTITVPIVVQEFPSLAKGTYRGLADRSNTTLNDNLGNLIQADISAIGAISGKVFRGTTAYSFIAGYVDATANSTQIGGTVFVPRPGATSLLLNFLMETTTGVMTGTLSDGVNVAAFTWVRSPWTASGPGAATAFAKSYTGVFQLQSGQQGDPAYPQGENYAVSSVTPAGAVSGAVHLADGTRVTFTTQLGPQGEIPLHIGAYLNTGGLHGWSTITSATGNWDGTDTFFKAQQSASSITRSYKAGVPLHTLTLVGGVWTKPTSAPPLLLGVSDNGAPTAPDNAGIRFTQGGIDSSNLATAGIYDVDLRIKAPSSTFVLPAAPNNPGKLSLKFATLATGEITGSFATTDPNPVLSGKTVPRTAPYFGVIVQRLNQGRGHFNLAKLPDANQTNATKTEILSGLTVLQPLQ